MRLDRGASALAICSLIAIGAAACGDDDAPTDTETDTDTDPVVSINATPTAGTEPLTVQFFSIVSGGDGALTYSWSFGDGETSSAPNPAHTFDASGSPYAVTLSVTDADGDAGGSSIEIVVGADDQPTVTASATPTSGAAPLAVDFDCSAVGGDEPVTVSWTLGEGSVADSGIAYFTYLVPGTYTAVCEARDANGDTDSASVTITVGTNSMPEAVASASPISGVAPLDVDFNGLAFGGDGTLTYEWDFGDAESDTGASVAHTYVSPGLYTAVLTVTDEDGDSDSDIITINVDAVHAPTITEVAIVAGECAVPRQTQVELSATAIDPDGDGLLYNWTFVSVPLGSTADFNNEHVVNPVFMPDMDGTYQIRVFVSDGTHTVASDIVTVTAGGPETVTVISGSPQTGVVDTTLPDALVVEVTNVCGATVADADVRWIGSNAMVPDSYTLTDSDGLATNHARLGIWAGAATVTASSFGASTAAVFDFTAEPGPAAALLMQDASSPVAVSDTVGRAVVFDVTDSFGNAVTGPDLTFDVTLDAFGFGTSAVFSNADCSAEGSSVATGVATSGGTVTVYVCNTVAQDAFVGVYNLSDEAITVYGWDSVFTDDVESDAGWDVSSDANPWQRGTPSYPAGLAPTSGSSVWGTVLDGPLEQVAYYYQWFTGLERRVYVDYPYMGEIYYSMLRFNQFYEIDGCAQATVRLDEPWGYPQYPIDGYNGGCTESGFQGSSGDWRSTMFALDPRRGDFSIWWTIHSEGGDWGASGAGWYIDDVELALLVSNPRIRFAPGASASVAMSTETSGTVGACTAPGGLRAELYDAFGNRTGESGVELTFVSDSSTTTFGLVAGNDFSDSGTDTDTATTVDGVVRLLLNDSVLETVNVTGTITGDDTSTGDTAVDFAAPPASEDLASCSDGYDNDCNGWTDCEDPACAVAPVCNVEGDTCSMPLDAGDVSQFEGGVWVEDVCAMAYDYDFSSLCDIPTAGGDFAVHFSAGETGFNGQICWDGPSEVGLMITGAGCDPEGGVLGCGFVFPASTCVMLGDVPPGDYHLLFQMQEPGVCGFFNVTMFPEPVGGVPGDTCVDPIYMDIPPTGGRIEEICEMSQQFDLSEACEMPPLMGSDAVFRFFAPVPGDYEICVDAPFFGAVAITPTEFCEAGALDCVGFSGECAFRYLDPGEHDIVVQAAFSDECGPVNVSVTPLGPP